MGKSEYRHHDHDSHDHHYHVPHSPASPRHPSTLQLLVYDCQPQGESNNRRRNIGTKQSQPIPRQDWCGSKYRTKIFAHKGFNFHKQDSCHFQWSHVYVETDVQKCLQEITFFIYIYILVGESVCPWPCMIKQSLGTHVQQVRRLYVYSVCVCVCAESWRATAGI